MNITLMWRKVLIVVSTLLVAFTILFASVLRTASVRYEFEGSYPQEYNQISESNVNIDYYLPYPGKVLPDSPLWPLKALRDKVWLLMTTDPSRRAELKLLFADKRLGSAKVLFEKGKIKSGLSTLTKAEKYLEEASVEEEQVRKRGIDTFELLTRLANSSLKHFEVTQEILEIAPSDVKPLISKTQDYPKKSFEKARNGLLEKGKPFPQNPFVW